MQLKNFLFVLVGILMDGTLIKKTVLNSLFQCINHFSYAFKKQEMVQVQKVNIHVEYH